MVFNFLPVNVAPAFYQEAVRYDNVFFGYDLALATDLRSKGDMKNEREYERTGKWGNEYIGKATNWERRYGTAESIDCCQWCETAHC